MVYAVESLGEQTGRKLKMKSDPGELKILMKEVREQKKKERSSICRSIYDKANASDGKTASCKVEYL